MKENGEAHIEKPTVVRLHGNPMKDGTDKDGSSYNLSDSATDPPQPG